MSLVNCPCGGNKVNQFYSLFTCDHANCKECHNTLNICNTGLDDSDNGWGIDSGKQKCESINFYNLKFIDTTPSKIKAFGYCDTAQALGLKFTDGTKRLILNVDKSIYDALCDLNQDLLYNYIDENIDKQISQCINIP